MKGDELSSDTAVFPDANLTIGHHYWCFKIIIEFIKIITLTFNRLIFVYNELISFCQSYSRMNRMSPDENIICVTEPDYEIKFERFHFCLKHIKDPQMDDADRK